MDVHCSDDINYFYDYVGFEVLTAVTMKNSIFWDITPHSPVKVDRRFGGTYCLRLQGRRVSEARNQHKDLFAVCFILVSCLAYSLLDTICNIL
jgi:hypothetical protein